MTLTDAFVRVSLYIIGVQTKLLPHTNFYLEVYNRSFSSICRDQILTQLKILTLNKLILYINITIDIIMHFV